MRWYVPATSTNSASWAGKRSYGTCRDITGVFREQAAPPVPRSGYSVADRNLVAGRARRGGQSTKSSLRRRRIRAEVYAVAADVRPAGDRCRGVRNGRRVEPSRLGAGLLDVTVDGDAREPLPTGSSTSSRIGAPDGRPRRTCGPATTENSPPVGRSGARPQIQCAGPASRHHIRPRRPVCDRHRRVLLCDRRGDQRPGRILRLEPRRSGRLSAGSFGAQTPFRLVWHDSAVARKHLAAATTGVGWVRRSPWSTCSTCSASTTSRSTCAEPCLTAGYSCVARTTGSWFVRFPLGTRWKNSRRPTPEGSMHANAEPRERCRGCILAPIGTRRFRR